MITCEQFYTDCYVTTFSTPFCKGNQYTDELSYNTDKDCSKDCQAVYESLNESDVYPFLFAFIQFIPALIFCCCICCCFCFLLKCDPEGCGIICACISCCFIIIAIICVSWIPFFIINDGNQTCFGYGIINENNVTKSQICGAYTNCWSCDLAPCGILSSGYSFSDSLGSTFCIWNSNSNICEAKLIRDIDNYDFDPSCSYSVSFLTFMYIGFFVVCFILIIFDIIFIYCYCIPKRKVLEEQKREEQQEKLALLNKKLEKQNISICDSCNHSFHDNSSCGVQVGYHTNSKCTNCDHYHHSSKCNFSDTKTTLQPAAPTLDFKTRQYVPTTNVVRTTYTCPCTNCNCTQHCTQGAIKYCSCGGSRLLREKRNLYSFPLSPTAPKGVAIFIILNVFICLFLDLLVIIAGICIATYASNNIYIYRGIFRWLSQSLALNAYVPLVLGQLFIIIGVSLFGFFLLGCILYVNAH